MKPFIQKRLNRYHELALSRHRVDAVKPIADPVQWATTVRRLRREPFTFDGRDYLHQLYRDDAKEVYVMKGRQTEISEMLVNKMLYNGHRYLSLIHI